MDANSAVPKVPLSTLLPCVRCHVRLRVKERRDSPTASVYTAAYDGATLLERLQHSRVLNGRLLLDETPQVDTEPDGTLTLTVRMPDPKPMPKLPAVDCAADLKELMDAIMEYNSDRDAEWDFVDDHGLDASGWTEEQAEEHDQILADIAKKREWIQGILRRVTGDVTLEF